MKTLFLIRLLFMLAGCLVGLPVFPQLSPEEISRFVTSEKNNSKVEIREFYARLQYHTAWIGDDRSGSRNGLLTALQASAGLGLSERDYALEFIRAVCGGNLSLPTGNDSLEAEIRITEAAIHFFKDYVIGNKAPPFGYKGLDYIPDCRNIPVMLADFISGNKLPLLLSELFPNFPEVVLLEQKIKWLNRVMTDSGFNDIKIISKKISWENKPLVFKLYQLGIIPFPGMKITDSMMLLKVKEAQMQFNLVADGALGANTLRELNVPLSARIRQLNIAVNYYRWLSSLVRDQSVIVVNIPAAYLKVYRDNKPILEMRMIVGKKTTPTPTLTSTVKEVILYPYWHVPSSIATKELLPAIRRNPGYINAGNYQVLNRSGQIMNPYSINWQDLGAGNFPYIIRQSTGCDNALGLLKLNFYNPFGVYLHDTPSKGLFKQQRRYYSHGCMRMQKPMDMGHLVLKNNRVAIDTLEQKGCLRNQSPITVKANEQMPVIVWYNPAGIDSTGRVLFFEDVYGKFN